MQWINNRTDGIRFINSYLNRYKDITEKILIELGYIFQCSRGGRCGPSSKFSERAISGDFHG